MLFQPPPLPPFGGQGPSTEGRLHLTFSDDAPEDLEGTSDDLALSEAHMSYHRRRLNHVTAQFLKVLESYNRQAVMRRWPSYDAHEWLEDFQYARDGRLT